MQITTIPIPAYNDVTGRGNYRSGREGNAVNTIVYHWIDGTQQVADLIFTDPTRVVSAHFSVEDDSVHQYVRIQDTAFHAGKYSMNLRSIGIEHSAQPGRDASDATYETSAQLVVQIARSLGKKVSDLNHIPHSAVVATACPGSLDIDRIVTRARALEGGDIILSSAPITPVPQGYTFAPFETNLSPSQDYSDEVKRMQQFLVAKGFMDDQGQNDGYYGPITSHAVNGYQLSRGVISPAHPASQFGWWYPLTRAQANKELYVPVKPSNI